MRNANDSKIKCENTREYCETMKWLALPYVIQCAWRSFWPEIYNVRVVFWDTWLSSIFIGRSLATIGEIAWIVQVGYGFIRANQEIKALSGSRGDLTFIEGMINWCAMIAVICCTLAEFFCNYAMITGNFLYNVYETSLWTFALGCLIPCSLYLFEKARHITVVNGNEVDL